MSPRRDVVAMAGVFGAPAFLCVANAGRASGMVHIPGNRASGIRNYRKLY